MFSKFQRECKKRRIVFHFVRRCLSVERSTVIVVADSRYNPQKPIFLPSVKTRFLNRNSIDEPLLRFNGSRQLLLCGKQIGHETVRCDQPGIWSNRLVPCHWHRIHKDGVSVYRGPHCTRLSSISVIWRE